MELYIPAIQEVEKKNPKTGRFLKGHEPWNKGKKAKEYMDPEKLRKNIENLKKYQNPNKELWKVRQRPVVALKNGEFWARFESAAEAERKMNISMSNIRRVCKGERKQAGGYQWKWEEEL